MKHFILSILISSLLLACDSNNIPSTSPKEVVFLTSEFSDADWLYNHYFGQYNLPYGFKSSIIGELKRVSNSFVLYISQGGDSQQMMRHMDTWARDMLSREVVKSEIKAAFSLYSVANIEAKKQASLERMEANGIKAFTTEETIQRILEHEAFIKKHNPEYFKYIQSQRALVDTYSLPYALPKSTTKVYATFAFPDKWIQF